MKKDFKKIKRQALTILCCAISAFFVACDSGSTTVDIGKGHDATHNPSQPVTVVSFEPESGGVGAQILVSGSNFGSDTSAIKVMMDDVYLNVIQSNGKIIYAIIPAGQPSPSNEAGVISVHIGKGSDLKEVRAPGLFKYDITPFVSTLAGYIDEKGNTSVKDGPINEAQFEEPHWLTFDQHKNLYILEEGRGMRFIDKDRSEVTTKFRTSSGIDRVRTISFTNDYSKMYITNDDGDENWNGIGTIELSEESDFTFWKRAINSRQCNGGDVHPQDNSYFFGSYEQGQVFKWDGRSNPISAKENSKELFKIQDRSWEFNIQFHPSGDFAYIVVINKHYILKSYYNSERQELELPVLFAGYPDQAGHRDGVATAARFNQPYQGTFDKEGNFYVCDRDNHCIRKVTPQGIVSTFAGRPQNHGYTDGTLRDAQFDRPNGIVYDTDNNEFFIADRQNRRIRKISMPKNN
ncbi:hypothetical protein AwDysgo_02770 [Bacteroidales bacterium]|nr:hypothetical protein AwDysgo_02770 [Bacteroidales bacterium]